MKFSNDRLALIVIYVGTCGVSNVFAQDVPQAINIQSRLTDNVGVNKPDGSYPITFSIWDSETVGMGNLLWQEQRTVTTRGGNFQLALGAVSPLPSSVISAPNRYLQTQISSETPLVPRIKLQSVPFALKSDKANKLEPNATAEGNLTVAGALSAASLSASNLTANRVLTSGSTGNLNAGAVTTTELGHLSGVSSNIQTQLNSKAPSSRSIAAGTGLTGGGDLSADRTISLNLGSANTWSAQQSFNAGICLSGDCRTSFPMTTSLPWTSITGIPAGFSDNVDNVGITAETDTLQSVTNRGNTTSSGLTVGGLIVNGAIGIGTANPQSALHVIGDIRIPDVQTLKWGLDGTKIEGRSSNPRYLRFLVGDVERMRIISDGNVGIGTASPIRFLDINGPVVIRGEAHLLPDGIFDGLSVRGAGFFQGGLQSSNLVTGSIDASGTKSFVQTHPNYPNKQIRYYSLEGSDVGTFVRGSAQLANGEALIQLPEHFTLVTSAEAPVTVQVTPMDDSNGLYVPAATSSNILVKELKGGQSNAKFYYLVHGIRKGYENAPVIQDNPQQP
ncbi:MAG: hypothetical protein HYT79_10905 [Elusimicrobia bacterium]|nr:hypothetical protein [Elusimicrobiota bacterium]